MTIILYSGTPGSGKSAHMAKDIYWAVKMGRPVVANFDINRGMFKNGAKTFLCVENDVISPDYLVEFARGYFADRKFREGEIKLYIDECGLLFNARTWKQNSEKGWIWFFQQHRKFGYDVILVAQFHEQLDKQLRTLIEYEVNHRKVNNVGLFGKAVSALTLGHPVFVGVTSWYGQKMRLGAEWFVGTRKNFRLYDSFKMFGGDDKVVQ